MKVKIHKVCVTVKESKSMIEREVKKEVTMAHEHEENRALVKVITELNQENDLVHLSKETEKLVNLCHCHKDYEALNLRLKHLLNDELKPAEEVLTEEKVELT